jgi:phosphoglycerate dehydrogenase-like enzyme
VNILPANGTTKDFFDREVLSLLKPTAYFYNIGRGVTIDQDFLGELLTSGKLAGAYLDVTNPEPLPTDHPLWRAPNCFITPHTAGGFSDEMLRLVQHFLANFDRFQLGQDLSDRVF